MERAAKPTQLPSLGANCEGTWLSAAASTLVKPLAPSTRVMAGEFSVTNTSAGEALPSCTIWFASSKSSPLRMLTLMPVSLVKPATMSFIRSSCWAL